MSGGKRALMILLTGGSGCGKSTYAERFLAQQKEPRIYIATMRREGKESLARIERHRKQREHFAFMTIEKETGLGEIKLPEQAAVLVECLPTWLDNESFVLGKSLNDALDNMIKAIEEIRKKAELLVLVTNEVGAEGGFYDSFTASYVEALSELNCTVAETADIVLEMAAGLPILLKGDKLSRPGINGLPTDGRRFSLSDDSCLSKSGVNWREMEQAGEMTVLERSREEKCVDGLLLVIGPHAAGKRRYIKRLGYCEDEMAHAVLDGRPVLTGLEQLIFARPDLTVSDLYDKKIIAVDEVGSGIIPADRELRRWREKVGRITNELSKNASRVVRVVAGIPLVLKDEIR